MKIREAVEYIILENDESIFRDQNRFIEYLNELSSDHPKELKVITHSLNTQILDLFFLSKEKVNRRISKIKWEIQFLKNLGLPSAGKFQVKTPH